MIFFLCDGNFARLTKIRQQKYKDALWFMSKLIQKDQKKEEKEIERDEF